MKRYSKLLIIIFSIVALFVAICFIPINASSLIPVIEEQINKEFGVKVHVDKLILRTGPNIKLKAPIMHVMYTDGHKFAQFDNVKFYIPWTVIFKDKAIVNKIYANKLTVRLSSNDSNLENLIKILNDKKSAKAPSIRLKNYSFSYMDSSLNETYGLIGNHLDLVKVPGYKSYKVKVTGDLNINDKKYCNYDLNIVPKIDLNSDVSYDFQNLFSQIKELDFHSDIVADVSIYQNENNNYGASGFINIDNISVLDPQKKDPKSFIYLTLWGSKASILSNIYTSQTSKVYIEGMLNTSKKQTLDLKVKTDEIDLADLYNKIKIFTKFSHIKQLDSLSGKMVANFSFKGDLNKIKSTGFINVKNAAIVSNGVKFTKINSDIDFSNNKVSFTNMIGYVNNAPVIVKGYIDKNVDLDILMDKVELKHLIPASYGFQNGIFSLIAKVTGPLNHISHKENVQITNLIVKRDFADIFVDTFKYDTNKSNKAIFNNIIIKTEQTNDIKIPTLNVIVNDDFIKIPETNVFMANSKMLLKSDIINYSKNNLTYNLVLSGFINSKDINKFKNYSSNYPLKFLLNGNNSNHNLNLQVFNEKTTVFDEPTVTNLAAKFDKKMLKIEDFSLITLNGKFSDDVKANLKGSKKVTINGGVEFSKQLTFKNIRVFIPQLLNVKLNDAVAQLKGDIFINGNCNNPDLIGQLLVQNLHNSSVDLTVSNATVDFNKQNIIFDLPLIKIEDTSFAANGLLSTDFTKTIDIKTVNVKSKYINLDTLLMYKDSPLLRFLPIKLHEGKLFAERIMSNIYNSPLYLTAFNSEFSLKDNILNLNNIKTEILNGKLEGKINYNLLDEHFSVDLMGRGVSAEPIFNMVSARKDTINGVLDFDTSLEGELTSKKSLKGDVKFVVNNGRMASLGKLEHLLYAQNVIADNLLRTSLSVVIKAITLKDTGLFKYLRGDVSLNEGVANIKFLQSQGPLMALFIKGLYNVETDYGDLIILGRLSDEIISGLGAFGDFSLNKLMIMLTGEEPRLQFVPQDYEKIPQLPMKNTKEFRSIINGVIDKPSSVKMFNWISYSEKVYRQKDVPMEKSNLPSFIENLPY